MSQAKWGIQVQNTSRKPFYTCCFTGEYACKIFRKDVLKCYRVFYREGLVPSNAIAKIKAELPDVPVVREFLDFCATSQRGVVTTPLAGHRD